METLARVQKCGEDHGPEKHSLGSYVEAVIAEVPVRERSVRIMSRFDHVVMLSFASEIIRNDVTKIGKFIYEFFWLSVDVDADVRCCLSGGQLYEDIRLVDIDLRPEAFVGIFIQVFRSLEVHISQ